MAGTVTVSQRGPRADAPVTRIELAWISSAGGAADKVVNVNGAIERVVFNPGTPAPSDNYGVTLMDEDGSDVLAGAGANRDTANTESISPSTDRYTVAGPVALNISAAGDSKQGKVVLYVR